MKKRFIGFLLAMGILITPIAAQAREVNTDCKVNSVYFDPSCQAYYLDAKNLHYNNEGFIVYLFDKEKENKTITQQLNDIFKNRDIIVTWEDNDTTNNIDDDIILSFELK
jgi:hypothetical protein